MSQFSINFIVDAKYLGEVMAALQPYKIEDLGFKLVAHTSKTPRAGEKPAWQLAAEIATDASRPQPLKFFTDKLLAAGWRKGTVYNALTTAVKNKVLIKKIIDGKPHYYKGSAK